ncbi:hypothetical protein PCE1_002372 [Barthelona sp. PCE]
MRIRHRTIAIIGMMGVGKTSIIKRIVSDSFSEDYKTTLYDQVEYNQEFDNVMYKLSIRDTQGVLPGAPIPDSTDPWFNHLDNCVGLIFVYAVDQKDTLTDIEKYYGAICDYFFMEQIPAILVGNKRDIQQRGVTEEDGRALSEKLGMPFVEVSAKEENDENLPNLFPAILHEIEKGNDDYHGTSPLQSNEGICNLL